MPSHADLATQLANRKLARAGLDPEGKPLKATNQNRDDDDEDGEIEDEELEDEEQEDEDEETPPLDRGEVDKLKRDLEAMQNRLAPAQRDADDYRRAHDTERREREREARENKSRIEALEELLAKNNDKVELEDLLTPEELEDLDPKIAKTLMSMADKLLARRMPKIDVRSETLKVLEEVRTQDVVAYRSQVLTDPSRGLQRLGTLAYDPEFIAWSKEDENDMDSVMQSLLSAKSTEAVDRYAKIVAKRIVSFLDRKGDKKKPPTDVKASLRDSMRRGGKPQMTNKEANAKLNEAKVLSRSSNPKDRERAKAILASL